MLVLFGLVLAGVLVVTYFVTSASRKKSECSECTKKTLPKKAFIVDQTTGEQIEGERDFGFAIVSAIGGLLIGASVCTVVFVLLIPAFGDESCSLQGIFIRCVSYTDTMRLETTINLPIAFLALMSGLATILRSGIRIRRATVSRGKPMTCEFECPSCKHTWSEEIAAPE